jgi:ABC-type transport system involved in cytochrome bd biosynthesis fused ATPase/permease subunit
MKMSTGKDPNILFFDEVAENLDEDGVYRLYEAMLDIAKTNRVYVITHSPTLLHLLQSADVISVTKKDGVMKAA